MKYTDFKKMSSRERKAYLKAGGKVETTSCQKTAIYMKFAAVTAFIVWGSVTLLNKHTPQDIAPKLVATCEVYITPLLTDPESFKRDRSQTKTRKTDEGYTVDFAFTAMNGFGVKGQYKGHCEFDNNSKILYAGAK